MPARSNRKEMKVAQETVIVLRKGDLGFHFFVFVFYVCIMDQNDKV